MIEFNARGQSWSWLYNKKEKLNKLKIVGVEYAEGTPVPIPNTEVKLGGAENTWVATPWEDREMPTFWYSSIAQSVERMTVNHDVTGSSPVGGAKYPHTLWYGGLISS